MSDQRPLSAPKRKLASSASIERLAATHSQWSLLNLFDRGRTIMARQQTATSGLLRRLWGIAEVAFRGRLTQRLFRTHATLAGSPEVVASGLLAA